MVYSTDSIPGATNYNWTVPADATITGGLGTNSITVDFGIQSGDVSVRTENSCGNSAYNSLGVIIGIPAQPGSISGNQTPDKNAIGVPYSISPVPGAMYYHWTVPANATIASGQGTTAITVDLGMQSGNVSVRAENSCGNSPYTDLSVQFFSCGDSIIDSRDSRTYNTLLIGTQCWMKENLNVGTMVDYTAFSGDFLKYRLTMESLKNIVWSLMKPNATFTVAFINMMK